MDSTNEVYAASFLVGATQDEINQVGMLYPEDPTLVSLVFCFLPDLMMTCIAIGITIRRRNERHPDVSLIWGSSTVLFISHL